MLAVKESNGGGGAGGLTFGPDFGISRLTGGACPGGRRTAASIKIVGSDVPRQQAVWGFFPPRAAPPPPHGALATTGSI